MSTSTRIIPQTDYQLSTHLEDYRRDKHLTKAGLDAAVQAGPVWFVVADLGHELIEPAQCTRFWKSEVEPHLADYPNRSHLEDFPDEYLHFASRWVAEGVRPIILLASIISPVLTK